MKKISKKAVDLRTKQPAGRESLTPAKERNHQLSQKQLKHPTSGHCSSRPGRALLSSPKPLAATMKSLRPSQITVTPEQRRLTKPPTTNVRTSRTPPRINFNFDINNVNFFRNPADDSKKKRRRKTTEAHSRSPASDNKKDAKHKDKQRSRVPAKLVHHRKSRSQQIIPLHPVHKATMHTEVEEESAVVKYSMRSKPGKCDNKPKVNQDAVICLPNFLSPSSSLFGVCDGHGINGHFISQFVKEILPDNLEYFCIKSKMFRQRKTNKEIVSILAMAFKKTSQDLLGSEIQTSFSGSTAVVTFTGKNRLFCANIGDSRAVLYRQDNREKWTHKMLSTDHTPKVQKEATRILKCKGRLEPYRDQDGKQLGPYRIWLPHEQVPGLAMTRSFGDSVACSVGVTSQPEVVTHEITTDDKFMIIASDGLWEFISCEQAMSIVVPSFLRNDPDEGARQLERAALQHWSREENVIDDISIIVAFFRNY